VQTEFQRLNTRGTAFEWTFAPLLALTKSDRGFFLINIACFALMPGRVFSVLTRLGVTNRMAWNWVWLLPTGYCFLLQSGSISNDFFGGFFALCAVEFALRARDSKNVAEVWLSIFGAALMTGTKTFNILLLPAWGLAILPTLPLLFRRPVISSLVLVSGA